MRAVNTGQMIIQGIASCSFLCMNSCGCLFAANECTEECKFNEIIEPNNFNSYSSVKYSNALDIWYVALKNNSKPRRTRRKPGTGLGSLSEYILALPYPVSKDRLEALEKQEQNIDSNFKHHRRHGQICPPISCTNSSPAFFTKSPENCECKKKRKKHQNVNGSGSKLPSLSSKKKSSGDADFHSKKKSGHKNLGIKKQQSSSSSSEKLIKAAERVENADEREATTLALDDE